MKHVSYGVQPSQLVIYFDEGDERTRVDIQCPAGDAMGDLLEEVRGLDNNARELIDGTMTMLEHGGLIDYETAFGPRELVLFEEAFEARKDGYLKRMVQRAESVPASATWHEVDNRSYLELRVGKMMIAREITTHRGVARVAFSHLHPGGFTQELADHQQSTVAITRKHHMRLLVTALKDNNGLMKVLDMIRNETVHANA